MENTTETTAIDGGLPRRTVLAGAAWTIPVIAAATIAPTASASSTLQLAFDKASYNGTACSTITGAYVTATTNGVATAGASITVSLSNGYTFSGGATSATGLSGTDGRYTMPDVSVPSSGAGGNATATSGSSAASAAISATVISSEYMTAPPGYGFSATSGVPTGSKLTSGGWVLTPDGRLIDVNQSNKLILSNVAQVGDVAANYLGILFLDGTTKFWNPGANAFQNTTNVPANSVPTIGGYFLASDGRLINGDGGALKATNVAQVGQEWYNYIALRLRPTC